MGLGKSMWREKKSSFYQKAKHHLFSIIMYYGRIQEEGGKKFPVKRADLAHKSCWWSSSLGAQKSEDGCSPLFRVFKLCTLENLSNFCCMVFRHFKNEWNLWNQNNILKPPSISKDQSKRRKKCEKSSSNQVFFGSKNISEGCKICVLLAWGV